MFKEIITAQKYIYVFINYSRNIFKYQNNFNYKKYLRSTINKERCCFQNVFD